MSDLSDKSKEFPLNPKSFIRFDDAAKEVYLRTLAMTGRRGAAAKAAGICLMTAKTHRDKFPEFAEACELAMDLYRDSLEQEVYRRAVEGVNEPVYQGGRRVVDYELDAAGRVELDEEGKPLAKPAVVKKYSDRLLELHVKRHIPEYRERSSLNLNTSGGVLVVPGVQSVEDWQKRFDSDESIEGEVDDNGREVFRG